MQSLTAVSAEGTAGFEVAKATAGMMHCHPAQTALPPPLQIRTLQKSRPLAELSGGGAALRLLPLHGGLPPQQQQRVFDRPPPGVRKVGTPRKQQLQAAHGSLQRLPTPVSGMRLRPCT